MKEKITQSKDERRSDILFLFVFFICSLSVGGLAVLCVRGVENSFVQAHVVAACLLVCAIVAVLCGFSVWFVLSKKERLAKTTLSLYILLLFSLTLCWVLQSTGFFQVVKSPEKLRAYLEKAGIWMPIFYILVQFLQVVVLPIPSIVSTLAGVALFGPFWTMIYSLAGILAGSVVAFFIGRKLGYKAVSWMVGEESLRKWQRKLKGKDNLVLSLAFVLPVFPDDILCFLAGLSSMSTRYFLSVIFFSRALAISATCYSIDFIPLNTWWGLMFWGIFLVVVIVGFALVYRNSDRIQRWWRRCKNRRGKAGQKK